MAVHNVDNAQNILGYNSADNAYTSDLVVANEDGSIIERLEDMKDQSEQIELSVMVAADFTGTASRFTVTGAIEVISLGLLVTTAIPAGANTCKFSFTPSGGVATDLCGATDTASAAKNQFFMVDGVKATGLVKSTDPGISVAADTHMPIRLSSGVVNTIFSAGPPATGAGTVFMRYKKLTPGTVVTGS